MREHKHTAKAGGVEGLGTRLLYKYNTNCSVHFSLAFLSCTADEDLVVKTTS